MALTKCTIRSRVRLNNPTAQLVVFGSSHNGFAFENSDLDISLTFADRNEDEVSLFFPDQLYYIACGFFTITSTM